MTIENTPPDSAIATDSGEIGGVLGFTLIESPVEAVILGEAPDTVFPSAQFAVGRELMLAEIRLDETIYLAGKGIRHPERMYRGKVKSFGSIIRSMPIPAGMPQISDAILEIIDTDGELRQLFAATPPNNRKVVMKIGDEGQSESLFETVYTGIISHATFPPGLVRLNLKDQTNQFLTELLPNVLTRENFLADPLFAKNIISRTEGAFDEREIFSPIVFGIVSSDGLDTIGSMNAVRLDSTTFNLAQHPIPHGPIRIFIKDPDNKPDPDQEFVELVGGFSIVEVSKTIEGVDYIFTHVVFGSARATGYEVRWDGEGMTDDGTQFGNVIRDPAEAIKQYLIRIAQRDEIEEIDSIGFAEAGVAMSEAVTGGVTPGLFIDGAITQRITHQEVLSRLLRSFGLFFFTDKRGKLTIRFIAQSDDDRVVLDDLDDIYVKSEVHSLGSPIFNEVLVQYSRTNSDQNFNANLVITDEDAVTALNKVERTDQSLFFVRDDFVADFIGRNFLRFTSPGSFRIVITTPGHLTNSVTELGRLIGITNYSGLDISGRGYENKEFLIHKIEFRTDTKQLRIHAVAGVTPPSLGLTESTSLEFFSVEADPLGVFVEGPWLELTGRPPLDAGFANPVVLPFTPKWITIEVANGFGGFPGIPVPNEGRLDFGKGSPGNVEVVLEDISILTDQTGVDANRSRQYSFPYEGWRRGDRLFVRASDNGTENNGRHNWNGDITMWR